MLVSCTCILAIGATLVLTILITITDRLASGITVADIDFSQLDSIRTRMPISKVSSAKPCRESALNRITRSCRTFFLTSS